jgi:hypothetical protein
MAKWMSYSLIMALIMAVCSGLTVVAVEVMESFLGKQVGHTGVYLYSSPRNRLYENFSLRPRSGQPNVD